MSIKKIVFISPVLLYKQDLFRLEQILRALLPESDYDFHISAFVDGQAILTRPYLSLEELLQEHDLPPHLDGMSFELKIYDSANRENIIRSIRVYLSKRIADIHLFAEHSNAENSAWVSEARKEIETFFDQRQPWYSYIARSVPPIFNLSNGLALLMVGLIIVAGDYKALVFPILLVIAASVFLTLGVRKIFFRYARLCLFDREQDTRPNYELYTMLLYVLILAIAIAGTAIMTWEYL